MTSVISRLSGPFGLPRGPVLVPGQAMEVTNWEEIKEHQHIKHLMATKAIEVVGSLDHDGDGKPGGSEPQGEVSADLEKLREDAKALGIKVHWKHSAETIQAAIDAKLAE